MIQIMSKNPEGIYVLVAFPAPLVEARDKVEKIDREFSDLMKRFPYENRAKMKETEEYERLYNENLNLRNKYQDKLSLGPYNRGYFKTQKDAIDFIEKYPNHIHEGAYYTILCIEFKNFGEPNPFAGVDSVLWFEGDFSNENGVKYNQIDPPTWSKGYCGWAD